MQDTDAKICLSGLIDSLFNYASVELEFHLDFRQKKASNYVEAFKTWYSHGDSNPGYRREKAMS